MHPIRLHPSRPFLVKPHNKMHEIRTCMAGICVVVHVVHTFPNPRGFVFKILPLPFEVKVTVKVEVKASTGRVWSLEGYFAHKHKKMLTS